MEFVQGTRVAPVKPGFLTGTETERNSPVVDDGPGGELAIMLAAQGGKVTCELTLAILKSAQSAFPNDCQVAVSCAAAASRAAWTVPKKLAIFHPLYVQNGREKSFQQH